MKSCEWCHDPIEDDEDPIVINAKSAPKYVHEGCIRSYVMALKGIGM